MAQSTWDTSKTICLMASESFIIQTAKNTKANSEMAWKMVLEITTTKAAIIIRGLLSMTWKKAKEQCHIQIKISTMGNGKQMRKMARDFISLLLEVYIKGLLRMIWKMGLEFSPRERMLSRKSKAHGKKTSSKDMQSTSKAAQCSKAISKPK